MAVQPSEKNIKDVLDVLGGIGITRDEAIARLKVCGFWAEFPLIVFGEEERLCGL